MQIRLRRMSTAIVLCLCISVSAVSVSFAQNSAAEAVTTEGSTTTNSVGTDKPSGIADRAKIAASYYLDSRGFTTAAIGLSYKPLPGGFALWGFTDWQGAHDSDSTRLTRSFSEYRLSHPGASKLFNTPGLAFEAELNSVTGCGNDVVRYGMTHKHTLATSWGDDTGSKTWLQWRAFPYESDDNGGQLGWVFFFPITPTVHIKGFADYNIIERAENRWVVEPELYVQISRRLWALLEYRYNQFEEANPAIRGSAVAIGIRYWLHH